MYPTPSTLVSRAPLSSGLGELFLVGTPIGNLGDLSARAVETLRSVDIVICEDTRHSKKLLDAHGLRVAVDSLPAFDEAHRVERYVAAMAQGKRAALITDAGMPGISDPGERLVAEAVAAGIKVTPIPGPCALVTALAASGLPSARFHFLGFLPRQKSEAAAMLEEVRALRATLVLYEGPTRVVETLHALNQALGPRRACVARELTKLHEDFQRGSLVELAQHFENQEPRGEFVVVVEGHQGDSRWSQAQVLEALGAALKAGGRHKEVASDVAQVSGWSKTDLYRLALGLKGS